MYYLVQLTQCAFMKKTTDNNLVNFKQERSKRIHDIHEKKLQEVHNAFEKAFPLPSSKKANKKKKGKKK